MPQRKAASVLPDPVGAQISVLAPAAIRGQPAACAGVGPSNERSNQSRVTGLNAASGSDSRLVFAATAKPPILRCARRKPEAWPGYQGNDSATSASAGAALSRSLSTGSASGHPIPIPGSFQATSASVAGS